MNEKMYMYIANQIKKKIPVCFGSKPKRPNCTLDLDGHLDSIKRARARNVIMNPAKKIISPIISSMLVDIYQSILCLFLIHNAKLSVPYLYGIGERKDFEL